MKQKFFGFVILSLSICASVSVALTKNKGGDLDVILAMMEGTYQYE